MMMGYNGWPAILVACVAWLGFTYSIQRFFKSRPSSAYGVQAAKHSLFTMLALAVAVPLVTVPGRVGFNGWVLKYTGLYNLSQFIEGLGTMVAAYHIIMFGYVVSAPPDETAIWSKRLRALVVLISLGYIGGYFTFPARGPMMDGDVPTTLESLLLKEVPYLVCFALIPLPIRTYWVHMRSETNRTLRARLLFWIAGIFSAVVLAVHSSVWMAVAYLNSGSPLLPALRASATLALMGTAFWMFGFLPEGMVIKLVGYLSDLRCLFAYFRVRASSRKLDRLILAPYGTSRPGLWELIRRPQFYLYKLLIGIMDREELILEGLVQVDAPGVVDLFAELREKSSSRSVQSADGLLHLASLYQQVRLIEV
jgi:hypothetical protein